MLMKFEQNSMVQIHKMLSFLTKKKMGFYNHFWQKVDVILEDVPVAEIIVYAKIFI